MASNLIGLEIAEEGIRAVEVKPGRTPSLVAAGVVPLPEEAAKDSEILDPEAVTLALSQLWNQCRFSSRRVILGVANRRILVREYVSPRLELGLLKESLPFAVQDLLPVPANQAVLDFLPTSETEDEVSGLMVATVAEGIERLISTLGDAKIRTEAVDFIPFGLSKVLTAVIGPRPESTAIASIGEHTTSVVVVESGVPSFVRITPLDLASEVVPLTVTPDESGEMARRAFSTNIVPGVLNTTYDDLAGRIRNTLDFHASREGAQPVAALHITGAMATRELEAAMAARLEVSIHHIGVGDVLSVSKAVAAKGTPPPSLLNAIGIALGEKAKW